MNPSDDAKEVAESADPKAPRRRTAPSPQQLWIDKIRNSSSSIEVKDAALAMKELGFPLPDDEEILAKVLGQDDEELLLEALEKIELLLATQPSRNPRILKTRLDQAALSSGSVKIRAKCQALRAKVSAA